jgi:hypothetical protein
MLCYSASSELFNGNRPAQRLTNWVKAVDLDSTMREFKNLFRSGNLSTFFHRRGPSCTCRVRGGHDTSGQEIILFHWNLTPPELSNLNIYISKLN